MKRLSKNYFLDQAIKEILNFYEINNIKRLSLSTPSLDKKDLKSVLKCFDNNWVSPKGKISQKFTDNLAKIIGTNKITLTNSGTSAIELAINLIGIRNTDVLVQSLIFASPINAIINSGNNPLFVNSNDKFGIDITSLEDFMTRNLKKVSNYSINTNTGNKVSLMIVGHLASSFSNIKKLLSLSKKYNIEIIEDSSEALGSYLNNKHLGTYGRFGVLSFNGNKIITTGSGGALISKNKKDFLKIERIIYNGKEPHPYFFDHKLVGRNCSMSDLNAALGLSQILKLKEKIKLRKKTYRKYFDYFKHSNYFEIVPLEFKTYQSNYWLSTLKLKNLPKNAKFTILEKLNSENINARDFWACAHKMSLYNKYDKIDQLKKTFNLYNNLISLPEIFDK